MKKHLITNVLLFTFIGINAIAQTMYSDKVIVDRTLEKDGRTISLGFSVDITDLRIDPQHMITLTPFLTSEDGSIEKYFDPVVIIGKKRNIILKRETEIAGREIFETTPYEIMVRKNKSGQRLDYNLEFPFETWMRTSKILIHEKVEGCGWHELGDGLRTISDRMLGEVYTPVYTTNYLTPEVEEIKNRDEVAELRLNYKVASAVILPDFDNNAIELGKVAELVNEVRRNEDLTLTGISITGYASPEGPYDFNMKLSEDRARSLIAYLGQTHNIPSSMMKVDWKGEDWAGLEKAVENTYAGDKKDEVLAVLRNADHTEKKKEQLKLIDGGRVYNKLLKEIYPPLRRNTFVIDYTVVQFNLEKARQVIKTNPKLLSLNEMYLVAMSYQDDPEEQVRTFAIAAEYFPDSPVAVNNSAAALINSGNYDEAGKILAPLKDNPEVWNNLGIVMSMQGRYNDAMEYFEKARDNAVSESGTNMEELQKLLDDI